MQFNKRFIFLFSLILGILALLAFFCEDIKTETEFPVNFILQSDGTEEVVKYWENAQNEIYVFLPSYAKLADLSVCTQTDAKVTLGGIQIHDKLSCGDFLLDEVYDFTMRGKESDVFRKLVFVKSENMPTMYIDVRSGNMDYIHMDKDHKEPATIRVYDENGLLLHTGEMESFKGRGNSSWGAAKKPYNITFAKQVNLLGMGSAQRWVLLAEGFESCINIRNRIVYEFARDLNLPFTPDARWVDVYLNGEYAGIYLLSERNEVQETRVNISQHDSFMVSLEYEYRLQDAGHAYVKTDSGQALRIHYSDMDSDELDATFQSLENALLASDGVDPVTGKHWQNLIDLDSWVRKYLLEEVFGNGDGGSLSQYFYRDGNDPEGKIYAGPIWDYDMAMGGYDVWYRNEFNFLVMNRTAKEQGFGNMWFHSLYEDEKFYNRLVELYEAEFLPLLNQLTAEKLDVYIREAAGAHRMDGIRWGFSEKTITDELLYIRKFLGERTTFLSDLWLNNTKYHIVRVDTGKAELYGYFAIPDGEFLPELPEYGGTVGLGWFRADTDEPFDITQPIYEDLQIYKKVDAFQIPRVHYAPFFTLVAGLMMLILFNRFQSRKNERSKNGCKQKISA